MSADPSEYRVIEPSVLYVGTPVYLVATRNPDGSTNLAPASSHFALGRTIVLGLEEGGQSLENVRRHGELTVNFPAASQWQQVERLAGVTGRDPVPEEKAGNYAFEPHKFERAGFTPIDSDLIAVPRVFEVPLQLEGRVVRITPAVNGEFAMVETDVVRVHAASEITVPDTQHIDSAAWHPLIYVYRHFYDRGAEVGWTRKNPLARVPQIIERWELAGGEWEVVTAGETSAVVALRRCDAGELVETVTLHEADELRWAAVQLAIRGPLS